MQMIMLARALCHQYFPLLSLYSLLSSSPTELLEYLFYCLFLVSTRSFVFCRSLRLDNAPTSHSAAAANYVMNRVPHELADSPGDHISSIALGS